MERVAREGEDSTLEHLVEVVRDLRRGAPDPQRVPVAIESAEKLTKCVNCGYVQQGQPIDRCPECGLLWASLLHDPTCWSYEPSLWHWLQTALGVVTWNHRTRVRTSLIPATPESARFARLCALVSAVVLGLAVAVSSSCGPKSGRPSPVILVAEVLIGGAVGYGVLRATMWVARMSLQGVWRRDLPFVPASIHYAAAWWPPFALALLLLPVLLTHDFRQEDRAAATWLVVLFGIGAWAFWMWASVSESGHVRLPGLRITFLVIALIVVVSHGTLLVPAMAQSNPLKTVAKSMVGIDGVKGLGRMAVATLTNAPRTYALYVDCIPSNDEGMIRRVIRGLGATPETSVTLTGAAATLDAVEKAFYDLGGRIRKGDRFVLYVNGHGSQFGSGAILVADGLLLVQKMRYLVSGIPSKQCFVVIDSCFGGKFIDGLRDSCGAVVLASTDDRNVSFRSGLTPFWLAMENPQADWDRDGRITVKEAFLHSYRRMVKQGEEIRQLNASRMPPAQYNRTMNGIDTLSPQIDEFGEAREDDFFVETPPTPGTASQPAP